MQYVHVWTYNGLLDIAKVIVLESIGYKFYELI